MKKYIIAYSLLLSLVGFANPVFAGDLVVIVNKANNTPVDKAMVAKIYNGKFKRWPSGRAVSYLSLPDGNAETSKFCDEYIGKSLSRMKLAWSQMMFSGQALPPKQVSSDEEVKKIVSSNVDAIGFIKASSVDGSVKVVLK
jgi:ABC-type phosphate transport system substrate-binding protein